MENNPVTPAEQLKLQNNDPVEDSKIAFIQPTVNEYNCMKRMIIVFQIILWLLLVFVIIDCVMLKLYSISLFLFFFCYVINIFFHCCSPIYKYLGNKVDNKGIYDIMKEYFKAAPRIELKTESYHMSSSGGKHKSRHKVVTYTYKEDFKYYSFKDVSGLFLLDIPNRSSIHYIQLQVINEINFADSISYADYRQRKVEIYNENKNRDTCISYMEQRTYDNYKRFNLIKLDGGDMCFFQKWIYVIFILLTLGWIYDIIFNCYCIQQNFTVRKLVSTRYNLLDKEHSVQYNSLKPTLSIQSNVYTYDEEETGIIYESNKMAPPSVDDIERAKLYEKEIPKYIATNLIGNVGIVQNLNNMYVGINVPAPAINNNVNDNSQNVIINPTEPGQEQHLDCAIECNPRSNGLLVIKPQENNV